MLTTAAMMIDRTITVIGDPQTTHDDDDWQEPSSEHSQDHEDHQHESSDVKEYPDDPDNIQDNNVCLAYEDGYPGSKYFENQRIWDDRYE